MKNYTLSPFLWKEENDSFLLTNDAGRFFFLSKEAFGQFVRGSLPLDSKELSGLCDEGFAFTGPQSVYIDKWSMEVRKSKGCHFTATQLFIIVLTTACNQKCTYCQASAGCNPSHMDLTTVYKAIDLAFSSPANTITIEFQGGEPTMNPTVLQKAVLYIIELQKHSSKNISMVIVTNLTSASKNLLEWLIDHNVGICTSLDGPESLHNVNRPMINNTNSYESFHRGVMIYQDICKVRGIDSKIQAIQTTTRESLSYALQIVDEYRKLGCDAIYLRPLTPLGFAAINWNTVGYEPAEYLGFYRQAVDYIIELEKNGIHFKEITASILLKRILQHEAVFHTEHRSPCGGAIGQMAIQYNGDVYICDEARMLGAAGDTSFKIGTVSDDYFKLISSPIVHAVCTASCIEGLPFCFDCVYQPFCSTCPVVTYGIEKDIFSHQYESYHCKVRKGIFEYLFQQLKTADETELEIFHRWAD